MTREIKLALILGSALVLVVGVLVSDHLSAARKQQIAVVDGELATGLGKHTRAVPQAKNHGADFKELVASLPPSRVSDEKRAADAVEASRQSELARGPDATQQLIDEGAKQGLTFDLISGLNKTSQIPLDLPTTRSEPQGPAPKPAPALAEHTVREGDTLWTLAEKYLGDGRQNTKIADANKDVLKGKSLAIGMKLKIPAKPGETAPSGALKSDDALAAAPTKDAKGDYVVKQGDTLVRIARTALGNERRWEEILAMNESRISDSDALAVGTRLRLPQR